MNDLLIVKTGTIHQWSLSSIFSFLLIFTISFVFLLLVKWLVTMQVRRTAAPAQTSPVHELILRLSGIWNWFVLLLVSLYPAVLSLSLSPMIQRYTRLTLLVLLGFYVLRSIVAVINFLSNRYIITRQRYEPDFDPTIFFFLRQIITGLVWIIAVLFLIQNLGYDVTTLVGGLGLGGLAIAFAVQNLLADMFSSISLYFDKPFKIGDYIVVGTDAGVVKKIGIKSTRLQTLQGEELVISNKELTETRVNNFKKMQTRRVAFELGIDPATAPKLLAKIPPLIESIIAQHELARFDRSHLRTILENRLVFESVYHVESSEMKTYLDIQQAINLALLTELKKLGVELAKPVR